MQNNVKQSIYMNDTVRSNHFNATTSQTINNLKYKSNKFIFPSQRRLSAPYGYKNQTIECL